MDFLLNTGTLNVLVHRQRSSRPRVVDVLMQRAVLRCWKHFLTSKSLQTADVCRFYSFVWGGSGELAQRGPTVNFQPFFVLQAQTNASHVHNKDIEMFPTVGGPSDQILDPPLFPCFVNKWDLCSYCEHQTPT